MKAAFLLISLIALSQSTNIVEYLQTEVDTEYGRTLVKNIELQLESGAHVDDLTTAMRSVQDNLQGQLADGEAHYDESRDACSADLAELNGQRTQAEADYGEAHAQAYLDSDTLASREAERDNKQFELESRYDVRDGLEEQRQNEMDMYHAEQDEYNQVLMLLSQVREIVAERLTAGTEFLETSTSMSRAAKKLRSFSPKKTSYTKKYTNFFGLLAQLVEKSSEIHTDQSFVENINRIVDRMEDNLQISQQFLRENENQRAEDHAMLMTKINGHINTLKGNLVDLDTEISNLNGRINASAERVANAEETWHDFVSRIEDRENECAQDQVVWENFYNNISAELSTASRLMYLLVDKHALLSRFGL